MKNYRVALNLFKTIIMQDREKVWNWKEVIFISHSPQFIMQSWDRTKINFSFFFFFLNKTTTSFHFYENAFFSVSRF